MSRAFFWVRPAGRTCSEVKVLYSPDKGLSQLSGKGFASDCESFDRDANR